MIGLVDKLLKAALEDEEFISEFVSIKGNECPEVTDSILVRSRYAFAFYGWLIGKHGPMKGEAMFNFIINVEK